MEQHLKEVLKELQIIFRIQDYEIGLIIKENMNEEGITFFINDAEKVTIELKKTKEQEMIKTLIHEVVHIIKRNSQEVAMDNIEDKAVKEIYRRFMEREQEKLTSGIYNLLRK